MKKLLLLLVTISLTLSTTSYGAGNYTPTHGGGDIDNLRNVAPSASDYTGVLDVNKSTATSNWLTRSLARDANGDTLTATVKTQGMYGTFVVTGYSLSYLKTIESKTTDTGIITISDGLLDIDITVSINALYWNKIAASYHNVAIKSDGTLWSWGYNGKGELGDGTTADRARPRPTQKSSGDNSWSHVAAGYMHSAAIKSDGTLWAWGYNGYGQLGDGTKNQRIHPTQESSGDNSWSHVAAGYNTAAIKSDGTLWAWGRNTEGQLGDGSKTGRSNPTQESSGSSNWVHVAVGFKHTVAIKSDGTLWAWGWNDDGQLGDGTRNQRIYPIQESSGSSNWVHVAAGYMHSVAIKSDGTLWAWGRNTEGQLGDGTTTTRYNPTQESSGDNSWSHVAAGYLHSAAIKSDGTLWAWGTNGYGQLGDGTKTLRTHPTQESSGDNSWSHVAAGSRHSVAIKNDGTLWAWGSNYDGQLGDGNRTSRSTPTRVGSRKP